MQTLQDSRILVRDVVVRRIITTWFDILYKFETKEDEISLSVKFPHWKNSSIRFIFTFEGIDSVLDTDLPNLTQATKLLCENSILLKDKLELILHYIQEADHFITKYGIICDYQTRLRERFTEHGYKVYINFNMDYPEPVYLLYIAIPEIGVCSFDIASDLRVLFSIESGMSRKMFGIYDKKEEAHHWRKVPHPKIRDLCYTVLGNIQEGVDVIYTRIENALLHSLNYLA